MAIDYGAGSERRGAYANLAKALGSKLEAENKREAEDIRRAGLFGTGITQDNLSQLARTGLGIAEFGEKRAQSKMDRARDSFQRRQDDLMDAATRFRKSGNDEAANDAILQAQHERNSFEDSLQKFEKEEGIWGGFGSGTVEYDRNEGFLADLKRRQLEQKAKAENASTSAASATSGMPKMDPQVMAQKRLQRQGQMQQQPQGSGRSFHDPNAVPDWRRQSQPQGSGRSFHDPSAVPEWRRPALNSRPNQSTFESDYYEGFDPSKVFIPHNM